MSKYWSIIVLTGSVVAGYAVTQERVGELQRRQLQTEQSMANMATKADLARVEAGVTFLVQREMTKAAK